MMRLIGIQEKELGRQRVVDQRSVLWIDPRTMDVPCALVYRPT